MENFEMPEKPLGLLVKAEDIEVIAPLLSNNGYYWGSGNAMTARSLRMCLAVGGDNLVLYSKGKKITYGMKTFALEHKTKLVEYNPKVLRISNLLKKD